MGFTVAIVGATGNVGREMLEILAERGFPVDTIVPLAYCGEWARHGREEYDAGVSL